MKIVQRVLPIVVSVLILIFVIGPLSPLLWAAPALQDTTRPEIPFPERPGLVGLTLKLLVSLVLIIFLIWLSVYLIKKTSMAKGLGLQFGGSGLIEVLERSYIAPKKAIYIIKVGGKVLALGVTDTSITTLAEFSLEEAMTVYAAISTAKGEAKGFVDVMKDITERFRTKG
ncbi:MAG: flagellar biosynthetic protein FliO [Candidatus Latescibacteria bacterium]|nr:flagellar biosynthetic protein FliO [Candidatus Latescibacterota bacterium]